MINSYTDERFEQFRKDINKIWLKKLLEEFHRQNGYVRHSLRKELAVPNFVLDHPSKIWGSWDRLTKTIRLSYYLFENYEWPAVVQTLKHEMAHMIVSEIWGDVSDNDNIHGELFKKACLIMEVDSDRRHSSFDKANYKIPEKERIVEKIHKLFCLGESNHKAEAEAAVKKAHALMMKYNISSVQLPAEGKVFVSRPVGIVWGKVPNYIKNLIHSISDSYYVKYIYMSYSRTGYGRGPHTQRYIELYGEPHNVDIAEYVFHFLLAEGERQWKEFTNTDEYKNRHGEDDYYVGYKNGEEVFRKRMTFSKVAFLEGFVSGFAQKLWDSQKEIEEEAKDNAKADPNNTLPVCVDDPLLSEKFEKEYNPCSWHSGSSGSNGKGRGEGRERGSNVTIRQGINRGSQTGNVGSGRMALTA